MKTKAMCCGQTGAMAAPAKVQKPVTEAEMVENLRSATTKLAKASVSLPSSLSRDTKAMLPSQAELAELKAEEKTLQAIVDDAGWSAIERQRAGVRLTAVRARIEQIEVALHPQQGQQYAVPQPYFEPRLKESKRAEYEAELRGLQKLLTDPDTLPGQRLRTEQRIKDLQRMLDKAGREDAVR
jgi:alpha-ketoglutarate-dependent taurine dioxygenase